MANLVSRLYEPLISRDREAMGTIVPLLVSEGSVDEVWRALTRFALLAYNPSQESKHALLACLALLDLRASLASRSVDALVWCARTVADARAPWSEPPIIEVPVKEQALPLKMLMAALQKRDRIGTERWLASRRGETLDRDVIDAASRFPGEAGHNLIIAVAILRLRQMFAKEFEWGFLRVIAVEWSAAGRDEGLESASSAALDGEMLGDCVRAIEASRGDASTFHALELFEAGCSFADLGTREVSGRIGGQVRTILTAVETGGAASDAEASSDPVYDYSIDFSQLLLAHAIESRLAARFPEVPMTGVLNACAYNLGERLKEPR